MSKYMNKTNKMLEKKKASDKAYQENKEFNEALRDLRDLFEKNKQIKDYKNAINEFNLCWKQITNDKNDRIEFDSDMPNPKRTRH